MKLNYKYMLQRKSLHKIHIKFVLFLFSLAMFVQQGCKKDTNNSSTETIVLTKTTFYSGEQYFEYNDSSKSTDITYNATSGVYAINVGLDATEINQVRMISDSLNKILFKGQEIKMPYFAYYGPYSDHGTQIKNNMIAPGSGSTVTLTVTRLGTVDFDGIFSGKVWSSRDQDTLVIHDGELLHVKLPSAQ